MERWRKCFPSVIYICHLLWGSLLMCLLFGTFLPPLLLRLDLPAGKHTWWDIIVSREASLYITKKSVAKCPVDIAYSPGGFIAERSGTCLGVVTQSRGCGLILKWIRRGACPLPFHRGCIGYQGTSYRLKHSDGNISCRREQKWWSHCVRALSVFFTPVLGSVAMFL